MEFSSADRKRIWEEQSRELSAELVNGTPAERASHSVWHNVASLGVN